MNDIDWTRLAVVTALHGEKCLGWLQEEIEDPKAYLEEKATKGEPIILHEARNLLGQASPSYDQTTGKLLGIGRMLLLMPFDALTGPLPSLHLIPSTWYFPGEFEHVKPKVENLLRQAVELETSLAAAEAGIVRPTSTIAPRRLQ
jgi:hypothetical protein